MTSNELKELVKKHFSLVEADTTEEINNEEITETFSEETAEEVVEEVFGEIADENSAFVLKFPGDELEVGDKVEVVTTDDQKMDAPDGEHKLAGGITIVTKDSVVESISKEVEASAEDFAEEKVEDIVEEVIEEIKDEMMEEPKEGASLEEIVEEIVSAVSEEMGYVKKKMAELEAKVGEIADAPAAAPIMEKGPAKVFQNKAKFAAFDVSKAKNADRIASAIRMMKTKK